jgi:L-lactate dehydrogenase complex protein LldG
MTTRGAFLARVRREMAGARGLFPAAPSERPGDPRAAAVAIREAAAARRDQLLARFAAEAERVGAAVHRAATAADAAEVVLAVARERGVRSVGTWARRWLGVAEAAAERLAGAGLDVFEASPERVAGPERAARRERLAAAGLGLTTADLAVAETGSLVLASGTGKGRAVSLLPACHVAVLGADRLIATLDEAGVLLEAWHADGTPGVGANVVFVTGPSRTADIELTLTRGVHGPREVHVVFVVARG